MHANLLYGIVMLEMESPSVVPQHPSDLMLNGMTQTQVERSSMIRLARIPYNRWVLMLD